MPAGAATIPAAPTGLLASRRQRVRRAHAGTPAPAPPATTSTVAPLPAASPVRRSARAPSNSFTDTGADQRHDLLLPGRRDATPRAPPATPPKSAPHRPASGGPSLLSQGRPATSSSIENGSRVAANAVDGNTGTRWSSAFSDPQWMQVDLGAPHAISRVVLQLADRVRPGFPAADLAPTASTWTTIYSTTTGTGGVQDLTVTGIRPLRAHERNPAGHAVRLLTAGSSRSTGPENGGSWGGHGPPHGPGRPSMSPQAWRQSPGFRGGSHGSIVRGEWERFHLDLSMSPSPCRRASSPRGVPMNRRTLSLRLRRRHRDRGHRCHGCCSPRRRARRPTRRAPSAPGTPVAATVTNTSITLAWAPSTDDVGVTGYEIFRSPGSPTIFTPVGTSSHDDVHRHRSVPRNGLPLPGAGR